VTVAYRPFKNDTQHGGMFVSATQSDGTVLSLLGADTGGR
jgi:hypothetical protein